MSIREDAVLQMVNARLTAGAVPNELRAHAVIDMFDLYELVVAEDRKRGDADRAAVSESPPKPLSTGVPPGPGGPRQP